jgi:hypothetical protein
MTDRRVRDLNHRARSIVGLIEVAVRLRTAAGAQR